MNGEVCCSAVPLAAACQAGVLSMPTLLPGNTHISAPPPHIAAQPYMPPRSTPAPSTDPHCTSCAPGKPDVCTICAMFNQQTDKLQWGVDKTTGKCVDCKIKNCGR